MPADGQGSGFGRDAIREPPVVAGAWTLSRFEVLTALDPDAWPLARVELKHARRGRLTEIAVASGGVESLFKAIRQIMGVPAVLTGLDLDYRPPPPPEAGRPQLPPDVVVKLQVSVEGKTHKGSGRSGDVLRSCAAAYLEALSGAARW